VSFKLKQWSVLLAILIFLVGWYTFIITAPVSITFEDGGELASEPYILGSAHPSGQPLYTLLGKPITLIPLGPISWRTNLSSSLASACALVLLFLVFLRLTAELDQEQAEEFPYIRLIGGVCACLWTIFSLDYWLQSILTEVYALNALFFIGVIYLALLYQHSGNNNYLCLIGLALGLSMGNHHTTIFLLPGLIYLVLDRNWQVMTNLRLILTIVGLGLLGLGVYLEMPLRSSAQALIDWGDPQVYSRFTSAFFRHQYAPISVARTGEKLLGQLVFFGFSIQQTFAGVWLSLLGVFYLATRLSRKAIFLFVQFLFYTIGFVYLINPVVPQQMPFLLRTFYLPAYMMISLMSGVGILFIVRQLYRLDAYFDWELKELTFYCSLLFLMLPAFSAKANYPQASRRYYYYTYDYVNNQLNSVKKDSVLFTLFAQDTFPLWYSQFVEGKRPDVVVVHQRLFINEWYQAMVKNFHPEIKLPQRLPALAQGQRLLLQADLLQKQFVALNQERFMFASQYCKSFKNRYALLKKGAAFEFRRKGYDYSGEGDPRRYYTYRGFSKNSKYYQMEARAKEVGLSSYLN